MELSRGFILFYFLHGEVCLLLLCHPHHKYMFLIASWSQDHGRHKKWIWTWLAHWNQCHWAWCKSAVPQLTHTHEQTQLRASESLFYTHRYMRKKSLQLPDICVLGKIIPISGILYIFQYTIIFTYYYTFCILFILP